MSLLGSGRATVRKTIGSSWARAVIALPASLLLLPFVLHRLTASQYGAWTIVSTALAFGGLADGGVRTHLVRAVAVAQGRDDATARAAAARDGMTVLSGVAAAVAIVGCVAAPLLGSLVGGHTGVPAGQFLLLTRLTALLLAASLVVNGTYGVLAGVQRSDVENWAGVAATVSGLMVALVLIDRGAGIWALFASSAVQTSLSGGVALVGVRRLLPDVRLGPRRMSTREIRAVVGVSVILLLAQVSNLVDLELDKILLARYRGSAASARYDVGSSLVFQLRTLVIIPVTVVLAGVAEATHHRPDHARRLQSGAEDLVAFGSGWIFGGVVVLGPALVATWLPADFGTSGAVTRGIAVAMALNAVGAVAATTAIASGAQRLAALSSVVNIAVNATVSIPLVIAIGTDGAIAGSIAGNGVATAVLLLLWAHDSRSTWRTSRLLPYVAAAAMCLIAIRLGLGRARGWSELVAASAVWTSVAVLSAAACYVVRARAGADRPAPISVSEQVSPPEPIAGGR